MEFNGTPEYAKKIIGELYDQGFTLEEIGAHVGMCKRTLSNFRQFGFTKFHMQLALEILAGRRVIMSDSTG